MQSQAQLNLDYTSIVTIEGVVSNRTLRMASFVRAGTGSVGRAGHQRLCVGKLKTQLTRRAGQAVDIAVDMFPGQINARHVDSIAPASGQNSRHCQRFASQGTLQVVQRIPVKIELNRDTISTIELRPGMSVIPTVRTKS